MSKTNKKKNWVQRSNSAGRQFGIVYIYSTYNNTILTMTSSDGHTLGWCSSGVLGFKGARRSTSFAAQMVGEEVGKRMKDLGFSMIQIYSKGLGNGRQSAMRGLANAGLKIELIKDITSRPFNGCRPKKPRRL